MMDRALAMFIRERGIEILQKNLYRNFVTHCCNFFEFGVISQASVFLAISRMQELMQEHDIKMCKKSLDTQRNAWISKKRIKFEHKRKDFSGLFASRGGIGCGGNGSSGILNE